MCQHSQRADVISQLRWLGDRSSPLLSSAETQSSPCHLAGSASGAPSLWLGGGSPLRASPMLGHDGAEPLLDETPSLPKAKTPPGPCPRAAGGQDAAHHQPGPGAAQGCCGSSTTKHLCPMRCQSPALPHCYGLPLAMSLMRLPREHCVIITYVIIIIIWGCPRPGSTHCSPHPQPRQPQHLGTSLTAARVQPRVPIRARTSPGQSRRSSPAAPGGARGLRGQKGPPSQGLPGSCSPPASLHPSFPKSCTSPTEFRAWGEE